MELSEKLHEPTKTVLAYTLDLAAHLNNSALNNEYTLFGGYAILSHLMREQGENVAALWRGSNDIDMGGTMKTLNAIRSGYTINSCLESPNIEDKVTIKLATNGQEECRIDFYRGDYRERFKNTETNVHFGIPVNVAEPLDLIRSKLRTPKEEYQHAGDIIAMLYVLERRGHTPKAIAEYFTGGGISKELHERLKIGKQEFKNDRLGLFPTRPFLNELERILHKFRPVARK